MNNPDNKFSGKDRRHQNKLNSRYSFDNAIYPEHWQELSDETLLNQYRESNDQLIVCYLMQRYKAPIVAISYSYLKDEDAVIDFTQDLFIKLVELLKHCDVQRFQSFLITVVKNKHKDELSKFKTVKNYEQKFNHLNSIDEEEDRHFQMDNPLKPAILKRLKQKGKLSEMEYSCIAMQLNGLKSGEIAELIDPSTLKLGNDELQGMTLQEILNIKKDKVYGAIERTRKKLRKILQEDFGDYFKD